MKKCLILLAAALFVLIFAPVFGRDLSDIRESGVLNFGTASEYRPFVYFDSSYDLVGLDIDIANEIGRRMDIPVRVYDMAFDGLIDSVNIGQVDLIGGAFSKTEERAAAADFSDVYYSSAAVFVARSDSPFSDSLAAADFLGLSIGVQRGTSFDQWIKTNLVGEGLVNANSVYAFADIDKAMKALRSGTTDVVMIDDAVYKSTFEKSGEYKVVERELADEAYAFAAAKDSPELIGAVNEAIAAMKADGTLSALIAKYADETDVEAAATITRPGQAVPAPMVPEIQVTPTPIPPFNQPANCKNVMVFMSDVTYPDGTKVNPGQTFKKTWQIYNNGSCTWYPGYQIVFVDGDFMGGTSTVIPVETKPGLTVDVSIDLTAPQSTGMYTGIFQMRAPDGTFFGPKLTAKYIVTEDYVSAPAEGAAPVITTWKANYYKGKKNFCPTVAWDVRNCNSVELYTGSKLRYRTTDCSGTLELCPGGGKGDYVYGIVAYGTKNASVVFTYTNTGEK